MIEELQDKANEDEPFNEPIGDKSDEDISIDIEFCSKDEDD